LRKCPLERIKLLDSWLIKNIERVSKWTGLSASWLVVPLAVVVVYEVIARKYFTPTTWAFELSFMMYGAHFMLGAAYCLLLGKHVRTDIWYGSWSLRTQGLVDSIMYIFLFLPGMALFFWLSWDYFYESWLIRETSPFSPWRPIIYPFHAVVPITVALIILQGIAELLKSIRRARGIEVPPVVTEVRYDES
jgi:TRAP-type mannitol/chloroaromatic compound transport system permease small subunit